MEYTTNNIAEQIIKSNFSAEDLTVLSARILLHLLSREADVTQHHFIDIGEQMDFIQNSIKQTSEFLIKKSVENIMTLELNNQG